MTVEEIRDNFKLRSEVEQRGIEINRQGFCKCPFHPNDDTASLKIYDDQNTWYCFGCEKHGDIITFVEEYEGASFPEACRIISGENLEPSTKFKIKARTHKRYANVIFKGKDHRSRNALDKEIRKYWKLFNFVDEPMSDAWAEHYNKWQLLTYKAHVADGTEMMET